MTKITIIRHGNTFGPNDVPRRVGCRTDISLVESGHVQGAAILDYLHRENLVPDIVFASALKRAQETAKYISDKVHKDIRFNEIDHGPDENKTEAEILERLGKQALDDWNDFGAVPDGWDVDPRAIKQSWINFADECVKNREGETTAIVSSGGIIRFAPVLLNNGLPDGQDAKVKTGSISLFEYSDGQWSCQFWNKRP